MICYECGHVINKDFANFCDHCGSSLEIKPKKQTVPPEQRKRVTKQYIQEVATWGVNQAKWKAAQDYCLDRGWNFRIITEDHLGLN
jgi:DNA-directed RNA polymerase subunit RPC12/RpoP